jgi:hypothetical protein
LDEIHKHPQFASNHKHTSHRADRCAHSHPTTRIGGTARSSHSDCHILLGNGTPMMTRSSWMLASVVAVMIQTS